MGMMEAFPDWFTPRGIQREIIGEIESRISSGYKTVLLCAPTGVGKSLIGATFARSAADSFTVTASKHLQDQYIRDVPFLRPAKGKPNFACLKIMEAEKTSDEDAALRSGMTCDRGTCQVRVIRDGREEVETCEHKPRLADVAAGAHMDGACLYYQQKYEALAAPHSLWNYSMYFQTVRYGQNAFGSYLQRGAAVFDEAHRIEDEMVRFIGYTTYAGQMRECGMDPSSYDLGSVDSMIDISDTLAHAYLEKRRRQRESNPDDHQALAKLDSQIDSAERIRDDLKGDPGNFVVADPATDQAGDIKSVSVHPIDISAYAGDLLGAGMRLFMSATVEKAGFCETLGLDPSTVAMIDTPRSPFPVEHREVKIEPARRLSYGSSEEDELAVIGAVANILESHRGERGLILTSSVSRCHAIRSALPPGAAARVRICHSTNPDGRTQAQILEEHAADPGGVLLSSSLWEGVDLSGDLSRFQVIAKVPYPPLGDRRVRAKRDRFPLWYKSQTIKKLLQGLGRSVRGPDDWATTYVLDGAVEQLLRSDHMIPRAYHDALRIGAYS
ncbi:MAG: helicase [Nitrosopumilus sp.]|nr:helicase [Nitrosopumilus sp.]MDA7957536.1 helicase [Nitrosopumilus sp.]